MALTTTTSSDPIGSGGGSAITTEYKAFEHNVEKTAAAQLIPLILRIRRCTERIVS
jgi:hypothetical protein